MYEKLNKVQAEKTKSITSWCAVFRSPSISFYFVPVTWRYTTSVCETFWDQPRKKGMFTIWKFVNTRKKDRMCKVSQQVNLAKNCLKTSYLGHPENQHFFSGSMKSRSGSRVGDSGSFLDMISYHNFCPDRNTKFPKIPLDRSFGWIRRFLELRIAFRFKFSGWLR